DDLDRQLLTYLKPQRLLLVIDNFEHLLEGAPLLANIIENAPGIRLLITSRERLSLRGEWAYSLEGLSVPPSDDAENMEAYAAMRLFVQSARRAQSSFALHAGNQIQVARVCRLVGGMPLGIELAAAWLPVLSAEEIAQEIASSLDFLAVELRDVPDRHR